VKRQRYSIVATLGPASDSDELIGELRSAGASAFRLNTSHLTPEEVEQWLLRLSRLEPAGRAPAPVVLDLQGSKWRLGAFPGFVLQDGAVVELVQAAASEQTDVLPVPHEDFFAAAPHSSPELLLNDARCLLRVDSCEAARLRARVIRGGAIAPRKGITFRHSAFRRESLAERDRALIARIGLGDRGAEASGSPQARNPAQPAPLRIAISYVRDAAEMQAYRRLFGPSIYLIAKLERETAVEEAEAIAEHADELWLCRGDLGAEMGLQRMAEAAYRFSRKVSRTPVPVLLAGQVLEHMTGCPEPTRAEVCALYSALREGYRGVVLSDETAVGSYPLASCRAAASFLQAIPRQFF
jgi:pyruvate kinase